jgi:predicted GTPase
MSHFLNDEMPGMILVMGVTGAGKSYLINRMAGSEVVAESSLLDSCKSLNSVIP